MITYKKISIVGLAAVFVGSVLFVSTSLAATSCPLKIGSAYKLPSVNSVFYITKQCTKQVFSGPTAYFRYFSSWNGIRATSKKIMDKIPKDINYTIPAKAVATEEVTTTAVCPIPTGTAVKVVNGKTVYYITEQCTKQKFSGPTAFFRFFSSWNQVKIYKSALLDQIPEDINYSIPAKLVEPETVVTTPVPDVVPVMSCGTGTTLVNGHCVANSGCKYNNPKCGTNEDCVSNECVKKITWQDRVNDLILPGYQKTIDAKGNLVLTSGNYKVVLPDQNAEAYGKWKLNAMRVCVAQISDILGQDPYQPGMFINNMIIEEGKQVSACCFAPELSINDYVGRAYFSDQAFNDTAFWKSTSNNYNYCSGGHEELHRYFYGLKNPGLLEEGLSTYMERVFKQASPGYFNPAEDKDKIVCGNTSFRTIPYGGGDKTDIPFRNLTTNFKDNPRIYSYYTAYCFWDHIQKQYGDTAFKKIISNLYDITKVDGSKFVRDAVVPAVGTEIWDYLKNMGITPENDI